MFVLKAYKYRIYPTQEQQQYLAKVFGCIRFIYNKMPNNQNGTIATKAGTIKIPKLKTRIRMKVHRPLTGRIKSCTLSKTPSGKYFASVLVETDIVPLPKTEKKIGVDLGLRNFAITEIKHA